MAEAAALNLIIALISVFAIVFSAEKVVDKMGAVARSFGVSEVFIAITLVSLGTSLPEISVHIVGSLSIISDPSLMQSISATVLGMNIGSDIVQQTFVMGSVIALAAFLRSQDSVVFTRKFITRDYIPMIGAHLLVFLLALNGFLTRWEGFVLISAFLIYLYYIYGRREEVLLKQGDGEESEKPYLDLLIGVVAITVLIYSSDVFLSIVEMVVAETGVSGSMIGVATVGIVSALPEMVTAFTALRQRAEGLALGTLIGSNITNPLVGIGLGASISGYSVPRSLLVFDLPVQIGTAVFLILYLWNRDSIGELLGSTARKLHLEQTAKRLESMERGALTGMGGLTLILIYAVYIVIRFNLFA